MRALDLFCGGGGVCEGLQRLGLDVTGIDNDPSCERNYPGTFRLGDATAITAAEMAEYDLVWASPPCQLFSRASRIASRRARHDDLLTPLRKPLMESGVEWIIENVVGAPMRPDVRINGPLVGLMRIVRERWFDVSRLPRYWCQPPLPSAAYSWESGEMCCVTTSMSSPSHYYARKRRGLSGRIPKREAMEVMGISHDMTIRQIGEAVPPAFAAHVGRLVIDGQRRLW